MHCEYSVQVTFLWILEIIFVSDFRDFTERGFIYVCVCVSMTVCKTTGTEQEMTKHTAERGSDNETKEQETTNTEREKVSKATSIKWGDREKERNKKNEACRK